MKLLHGNVQMRPSATWGTWALGVRPTATSVPRTPDAAAGSGAHVYFPAPLTGRQGLAGWLSWPLVRPPALLPGNLN